MDLTDAAGFTAILLDQTSASADQLCAADVNDDGNVDGKDVQEFMGLLIAS